MKKSADGCVRCGAHFTAFSKNTKHAVQISNVKYEGRFFIMKKRLFALVAAMCLMLSASACSTAKTEPAKDTASNTSIAVASDETSVKTADAEPEKAAPKLEYWTDDSAVAKSVKDYVAAVTDESSDKYVAPEDRIAVFDSDGTLFGELFPTYIDQCLMIERVAHDDTYNAPAEDKEYVTALEKALLSGEEAPKAPRSSGLILADAFKGFTVEEMREYFHKFLQKPAAGFDGMTYADGYYRPMVSMIQYLSENDFKVFIVSGAETNMLRELWKDIIGQWVPPYQIIGTQFSLTAPGQGDTAARDYTYQESDKVIYGGDMTFKNLKMGKVVSIVNFIGQKPIIAFGNSSGDLAMGEYTVQNGGKAYMLLCDDTERDYGKPDVAASFAEDCKKLGFETVSMKNDFATIYGDKAVKTSFVSADEPSALNAA